MPHIRTKVIKEVTHIGHLSSDADLLASRPSDDGPGISVSTDPDMWRQVAGLNGEDISLYCPSAHWVDAMAFTPQDRHDIERWALMSRIIAPCAYWVVNYVNEETGEFVEFRTRHRDEAAGRIGRTVEEEIAAAATGNAACELVDGYQLRPNALKKLVRWPDPLRWEDAIVLLYVREVVMVKTPLVVGIWWDEAESREDKSGPRGTIFPEALGAFEVETPEGDILSVAEAYPELEIPERKTIIDSDAPDRLSALIAALPERSLA